MGGWPGTGILRRFILSSRRTWMTPGWDATPVGRRRLCLPQVLAEERQGPVPRLPGGRLDVDLRPVVVEEGVRRPVVDVELDWLAGRSDLRLQLARLLRRGEVIVLGIVAQDRGSQLAEIRLRP